VSKSYAKLHAASVKKFRCHLQLSNSGGPFHVKAATSTEYADALTFVVTRQ